MQISRSAFDVLHLMKHSDLELYAYYLLSLDLSDLTRAGTYTRNIVSFESGTLNIWVSNLSWDTFSKLWGFTTLS